MSLLPSSIIAQQATLLRYEELNKTGDRPRLALWNGELFLYRKNPNSLFERVKQVVSQIFCYILSWFGNSFVLDSSRVSDRKKRIENAYTAYQNSICAPQLEERKNLLNQIAALKAEIKSAEKTKADLSEEIGTITSEIAQQKKEKASLTQHLSALQSQIDEATRAQGQLTEKIESLSKQLADWEKRKADLDLIAAQIKEEKEKEAKQCTEWLKTLQQNPSSENPAIQELLLQNAQLRDLLKTLKENHPELAIPSSLCDSCVSETPKRELQLTPKRTVPLTPGFLTAAARRLEFPPSFTAEREIKDADAFELSGLAE